MSPWSFKTLRQPVLWTAGCKLTVIDPSSNLWLRPRGAHSLRRSEAFGFCVRFVGGTKSSCFLLQRTSVSMNCLPVPRCQLSAPKPRNPSLLLMFDSGQRVATTHTKRWSNVQASAYFIRQFQQKQNRTAGRRGNRRGHCSTNGKFFAQCLEQRCKTCIRKHDG